MRIGFVAAWYNLWVGAHYDRVRKRLYILPLPCLGFWLERGARERPGQGQDATFMNRWRSPRRRHASHPVVKIAGGRQGSRSHKRIGRTRRPPNATEP
jgi:hypothetical protein